MIDTHTHLYLPEFEADIADVVDRARQVGVKACWLPGIDEGSLQAMRNLQQSYGDYFQLFAGLHPTEVKQDYRRHLDVIYQTLTDNINIYKGIGEIGLDLYWDRSYQQEQTDALRIQLDWAVALNKPVILHVRDAYDEIMPLIRSYYAKGLKGIFHCYAGNLEQALELTSNGFLIGVNGSITYKKTPLQTFLSQIPLKFIVTETDSPYLSPVPLRGKRNESSNIPLVVDFIASLYHLSPEEVAEQTEKNANCL